MAASYEDSFDLVRQAKAAFDEAAGEGAAESGDAGCAGEGAANPHGATAFDEAGVRKAYYLLYAAANAATMISPGPVKAAAESGNDLARFVDVLYRQYYRAGRLPGQRPHEMFAHWLKEVTGYIDRLAAQSRMMPPRR